MIYPCYLICLSAIQQTVNCKMITFGKMIFVLLDHTSPGITHSELVITTCNSNIKSYLENMKPTDSHYDVL